MEASIKAIISFFSTEEAPQLIMISQAPKLTEARKVTRENFIEEISINPTHSSSEKMVVVKNRGSPRLRLVFNLYELIRGIIVKYGLLVRFLEKVKPVRV